MDALATVVEKSHPRTPGHHVATTHKDQLGETMNATTARRGTEDSAVLANGNAHKDTH